VQNYKLFKNSKPVIAIDGTCISGKGTLAKNIAHQLNFDHLDTVLLYRYLAYLISEKKVDEKNTLELKQKFDFDEIKKVDLRTEKITKLSSIIASKKKIRDFLIDIQRNFADHPPSGIGSVIDGRDIGTVVIPLAEVKFFIDANVHVRTKRRQHDLSEKGEASEYNQVLKQIVERDNRDKNRKLSPLLMHKDALLIDTSELSKIDTLKLAVKLIDRSGKLKLINR